MYRHRIVYPKDFPIHGLDSLMLGNCVFDDLREMLLIHAGDIVESRAVFVNVRSNTWALSRDVGVILDHEEVSCLELLRVPS